MSRWLIRRCWPSSPAQALVSSAARHGAAHPAVFPRTSSPLAALRRLDVSPTFLLDDSAVRRCPDCTRASRCHRQRDSDGRGIARYFDYLCYVADDPPRAHTDTASFTRRGMGRAAAHTRGRRRTQARGRRDAPRGVTLKIVGNRGAALVYAPMKSALRYGGPWAMRSLPSCSSVRAGVGTYLTARASGLPRTRPSGRWCFRRCGGLLSSAARSSLGVCRRRVCSSPSAARGEGASHTPAQPVAVERAQVLRATTHFNPSRARSY